MGGGISDFPPPHFRLLSDFGIQKFGLRRGPILRSPFSILSLFSNVTLQPCNPKHIYTLWGLALTSSPYCSNVQYADDRSHSYPMPARRCRRSHRHFRPSPASETSRSQIQTRRGERSRSSSRSAMDLGVYAKRPGRGNVRLQDKKPQEVRPPLLYYFPPSQSGVHPRCPSTSVQFARPQRSSSPGAGSAFANSVYLRLVSTRRSI